jgi:hypothetical protein
VLDDIGEAAGVEGMTVIHRSGRAPLTPSSAVGPDQRFDKIVHIGLPRQ